MLKHQTLKDFKEFLNTIDSSFDDLLVFTSNIDLHDSYKSSPDGFEDFGKLALNITQKYNPDGRTMTSEFKTRLPTQDGYVDEEVAFTTSAPVWIDDAPQPTMQPIRTNRAPQFAQIFETQLERNEI